MYDTHVQYSNKSYDTSTYVILPYLFPVFAYKGSYIHNTYIQYISKKTIETKLQILLYFYVRNMAVQTIREKAWHSVYSVVFSTQFQKLLKTKFINIAHHCK